MPRGFARSTCSPAPPHARLASRSRQVPDTEPDVSPRSARVPGQRTPELAFDKLVVPAIRLAAAVRFITMISLSMIQALTNSNATLCA